MEILANFHKISKKFFGCLLFPSWSVGVFLPAVSRRRHSFIRGTLSQKGIVYLTNILFSRYGTSSRDECSLPSEKPI